VHNITPHRHEARAFFEDVLKSGMRYYPLEPLFYLGTTRRDFLKENAAFGEEFKCMGD
jgi:hypothetical protein